MISIRLSDLAERLGTKIIGEGDPLIEGFAFLDRATSADLSFITNAHKCEQAAKSKAGALLVPVGVEVPGKPVIPCESIWEAYNSVAEALMPERRLAAEIHPSAVIDPDAALADGVSVGPGAVIERGVKIGQGSAIDARVFVGEGVTIGANCSLRPNVVVMDRCEIGDRVILHGGVVVGGDGFRYEASPTGPLKIRQAGIVVIEDDVEVGANSCIDRAGLGETRIGRGTKIDNLVQIGHNVTIGQCCIVVSHVGIAGSVEIGSGVQIGGQAGIAGHLTIGDGVNIGGQAGVLGNIGAGETVIGTPALDAKGVLRLWALEGKLVGSNSGMKQIKKAVMKMISEDQAAKSD